MRRLAGMATMGLLAATMAAATEWDDYTAAQEALASGDCAGAVTLLERAIAVDGQESERKNTYGMHFERYVPHLLLARAHLCARHGDLALEALHVSEGQGISDRRTIVALRKEVQDLDGGASELVWRARQALRSGDLLWAQGLVEQALARAPGHPGGRALAAKLSRDLRIDRLLVEASVLLDGGDAAGALARAEEVLALDPGHEAAARLAARAGERRVRSEATARAPSPAPTGRPAPPAATPPAPATPRRGDSDGLLREAEAYVRIGDVQGALAIAAQAASRSLPPERIEALLGEIAREMARRSGDARERSAGASIHRQLFRDAVRAFHTGKYDDALVRLAVVEPELAGTAELHFYRGAAALMKYFLGGARDATLLEGARTDFGRTRAAAPGYSPDREAFSPRILEVFTSAAGPAAPLSEARPGERPRPPRDAPAP